MDLYLTSSDWTDFAGSRQIQNIERIKIGIFSYFLVSLTEPLVFKNTKHHQLMLTSTIHFVRTDYESRLPLVYDVYTVKYDNQSKIKCGDMFAKGVDLHKKDQ